MAEIEYEADLKAFIKLYQGLIRRYHSLKSEYPDFEYDFVNYDCKIQRVFIRNWDCNFLRISRKDMNRGLDMLVEMERELNKLK